MELTLLAYALGWIVLGLVAFTTVVPVGAKHPFMAMANIDSVIPFGLLGLLFVMAYPEDRRVVALLRIVTAAASESLALVLPGRHLRIERALLKVLATVSGLLVGALLVQFTHLVS